ncbi:hypothetical protein [uncultured Victivallis sp.]|uniref:hypothetical protein n=1 Tax=uncultured Victivallis sp. TaxID=354118 RepID=UPI0025EF5949|nr:hypothetical protein [uncultured Victivallis sp.]
MNYAEVLSIEMKENGELRETSEFKVRVGADGRAEFFDVNNDYWVEEFQKNGFYTPLVNDRIFTVDQGEEFVNALVTYFSGSYLWAVAR